MSSPWDPAISQAMQRHGGSNRSIPRTQSTPVKKNYPAALLPFKGKTTSRVRPRKN